MSDQLEKAKAEKRLATLERIAESVKALRSHVRGSPIGVELDDALADLAKLDTPPDPATVATDDFIMRWFSSSGTSDDFLRRELPLLLRTFAADAAKAAYEDAARVAGSVYVSSNAGIHVREVIARDIRARALEATHAK
jgi:hypothetical protein